MREDKSAIISQLDLAAYTELRSTMHQALARLQQSWPDEPCNHGFALTFEFSHAPHGAFVEACLRHADGGEIQSGYVPIDATQEQDQAIVKAQQIATAFALGLPPIALNDQRNYAGSAFCDSVGIASKDAKSSPLASEVEVEPACPMPTQPPAQLDAEQEPEPVCPMPAADPGLTPLTTLELQELKGAVGLMDPEEAAALGKAFRTEFKVPAAAKRWSGHITQQRHAAFINQFLKTLE